MDTFEQVSYPLASSSAGFATPPHPIEPIPPSPPSLPPSAAEDDEEGFMFVLQPSVLSIASSDSFQHVSGSMHNQEECNVNDDDEDDEDDDEADETNSVVSQKSDNSEFCVVIPECFKLDVPLSGFKPPNHIEEEQEEERKEEREATPSPGGYVTPPTEPVPPPEPVPPEDVSPNTARRQFTPDRVTLYRVWSRRSTDPLRYATGLVNTMSDLVSKHVRVAPKDTEEEVN